VLSLALLSSDSWFPGLGSTDGNLAQRCLACTHGALGERTVFPNLRLGRIPRNRLDHEVAGPRPQVFALCTGTLTAGVKTVSTRHSRRIRPLNVNGIGLWTECSFQRRDRLKHLVRLAHVKHHGIVRHRRLYHLIRRSQPGVVMASRPAQEDEKRLLFSNCAPWKRRSPLCHLDRSEAKWRDLRFSGPLLDMFFDRGVMGECAHPK
jgi:hypothetical protein